MRYTVKTLDGNRYEFKKTAQIDFNRIPATRVFYGFLVDGGIKYFNIDNVVSITEYEEEEDDG